VTLTTAEQRAGWLLAGVLAACGLAYVIGGPRPRRRRRNNPTALLRKVRRIGLADDGRVVHGLPERYRGVHVLDVAPLSREVKKIEQARQVETKRIRRGKPRTFTTEEGVRALLEANPPLVDFLEAECSHDCETYRGWVRGGRRGPKPKWHKGDGRFDAINERFERRSPGRKVASWIEAVYVTPPPSHKWDDFGGRLEVLEEATGLRLNLPLPAESRQLADQEAEQVLAAADDRIDALVDLARSSRLSGKAPAVEDAPF
jgi:hypothetical protein